MTKGIKPLRIATCIMIMLLSVPLTMFAVTLDSVSITLRGSVPTQDVEISMYDENDAKLSDNSELLFAFLPGINDPISRTISLKYSGNIPTSFSCKIAFSLTDLVFEKENKIETSLTVATTDKTNVEVGNGGDSFIVTFLKGASDDREIGTLTITAQKDSSSVFPAGDYEGSLTIEYTTMN
ncbi:MAG: hypothetical protein WCR05_10830 [Sphaerochaetaceae bacterium]